MLLLEAGGSDDVLEMQLPVAQDARWSSDLIHAAAPMGGAMRTGADAGGRRRRCRQSRSAVRTRSATARDRLCGGQAITVVTGSASSTGTVVSPSPSCERTDSGSTA